MLRPAFFKTAIAIALFVILALPLCLAQNSSASPRYEKSQETKLKGVVEEIQSTPAREVQLIVKMDGEKLEVYVAPESFLREMELSFAKGDQLEIVGAKHIVNGTPELLAREITRNSNTMTLRDDNGVPVWAGWNPSKK